MKLEAVDKRNSSLTCVATVADVLGDHILIHFDGWEDIYDYWCEPTSPYIHPVGWCQANGKPLSPPNGQLWDWMCAAVHDMCTYMCFICVYMFVCVCVCMCACFKSTKSFIYVYITLFLFVTDWPDIDNFTWEDYLRESKSQPVPARAFKNVSVFIALISKQENCEFVDKALPHEPI